MKKESQKGFIQIIVIIIFLIVAASLLGFDPVVLWTNFLLPLLNFLWDLFIKLMNFIVDLVVAVIAAFKNN